MLQMMYKYTVHPAGGHSGIQVRAPRCSSEGSLSVSRPLHEVQGLTLRWQGLYSIAICRGCRSRSELADSVPLTSRKASEVPLTSRKASEVPVVMFDQAACLLHSQYPPASVRLFAEFRRLRQGLPPAEARKLVVCEEGKRGPAACGKDDCGTPLCMAHKQSVQSLQSCEAGACSAMPPAFLPGRVRRSCGSVLQT